MEPTFHELYGNEIATGAVVTAIGLMAAVALYVGGRCRAHEAKAAPQVQADAGSSRRRTQRPRVPSRCGPRPARLFDPSDPRSWPKSADGDPISPHPVPGAR